MIGFIKRLLTKKEEPEDIKELRQWQKNTGYKNLGDYYKDHREEYIDSISATLGIPKEAIENRLNKNQTLTDKH